MGKNQALERDERTEQIENASYALGYRLLAFALLFDVAYRSFILREAAWDLMALVIASGAVLTVYQYRGRILGKSWLRLAALAAGIAAVVAIVLVAVLLRR